MRLDKKWAISVLVLGGVLLGACGSDDQSATSTVETATTDNLYGGVDVPPPTPDEPILDIANSGDVTSYSLNDLREFTLVEETVFEPFVKSDSTFVGVSMADLFEAAGIEPSDEVITIALNEYIYTNFASEFTGTDAFVAFEQDGGPIPMDRGGPLRIIVPNDRPLTGSLEVWNWSLAEIRVE